MEMVKPLALTDAHTIVYCEGTSVCSSDEPLVGVGVWHLGDNHA